MSSRPLPWLALLALLASLALFLGRSGGCAQEKDPRSFVAGTGIDLLVRRPDAVFEQPGVLAPVPGADWGPAGGSGWARLEPGSPWVLPDGSPYIETNQPTASLKLLATEPVDRELALTLWRSGGPAGAGRALRLELNGIVLPPPALTDEPTTHVVPVPAELWQRGVNVLVLASETGAEPDSRGRTWNTLAVSRVRWGEERLLRHDPRGGTLGIPASGGVRWIVESAGEAWLELAGTAGARGTLTVEVGTMTVRTGALEVTTRTRVEVEDELLRAFPLPLGPLGPFGSDAPEGDQARFATLLWSSADGAPLELARAEVFEQEPRARPLVLFLSVDTLAAKHCSVYGYGRRTTPELEELARDAVVFERCVANAPWTLPSYLSVLTGLYPSAHLTQKLVADGALDNHDYWKVADNRWTLAEALRARGYQTAASLDTAWLSPRFKIDQGFDLYDLGPASYGFYEPYYGIRYIAHQFERYLDELRVPDAPFFAFIHALDAHGPYWPEEGFLDAFRATLPADLRLTLAGAAPQTFGAMPVWMAQTLCPPDRRPHPETWPVPREVPLEEIIERYDEAILKTDHSIGEICDLLRARGLYDDAVIVVTGDHGESFAHGSYSHGVLWEDVVRVPLLLKLPANAHGGTRVDTSVQLVDLYPTLLELAGGDAAREYLHGRSLLELIEGAAEDRPTFSEGGHIDQRMVEVGGWKLIETRPGHKAAPATLVTHPRVPEEWLHQHLPKLLEEKVLTEEMRLGIEADRSLDPALGELRETLAGPFHELYHIAEDPEERHDLAARFPERVAELLVVLCREHGRGLEAREDARGDGVPVQLSPEELEALHALGYTGKEQGTETEGGN